MKKIQRSLYKKKKNQKGDVTNSSTSEQANRSPVKSPFGHALKKKFFPGKLMSRSQSMPEEPVTPVVNVPPDVFTTENVPEGSRPTIADNEVQDQLQFNDLADISGVEGNSPEQQTLNVSDHNGFHLPEAINSTSGGDTKSFDTPKADSAITSNLPPISTKEEAFSNGDNPLVEEDHIYDLPPSDSLPSSSCNQENLHSFHPSHSQHSYSASSQEENSPTSTRCLKFLSSSSQPRVVSRLTAEFQRLATQGWYWGPLTRPEAEDKLNDAPDGSFLVRDSSDERYLLSLSFRSFGRTLHTRIEHSHGKFSFYANTTQQTYYSVVDLIDHSMRDSEESGVFCYSRSNTPYSPTLPVFLTNPISRLSQVRTLCYLCRFVIRQYTRIDHIEKLPLPVPVKGYLNQSYF